MAEQAVDAGHADVGDGIHGVAEDFAGNPGLFGNGEVARAGAEHADEAGAKVIGPVVVGRHARVGANAVVLEDVPDGGVVVGIPARLVRVDGKEPLRAKAKDFHVKKPGLVFRVGGKDGQGVLIDNVKVWELEVKVWALEVVL